MRRVTAIFIFCIFLLSTSIVIADEEENNIFVEYKFEQPEIKQIEINGNKYDRVVLEDVTNFGNPGEPLLPIKGAYILIPQDAEPNDINIISSEPISLGEGFNVEPVGDIVTTSNSLKIRKSNLKTLNAMYPGELYSKIGTYSFRGYSIIVISLYPVQYNTLNGELFYYPELSIEVTTKESGKNNYFRGLKEDKFEALKKVDNPKIIETYNDMTISKPTQDQYDLLILTTLQLSVGFQPLKTAHEEKGLKTEIKTLSDISINPQSVDAEDIREFIRDEYTNHGIEYLLIGGDEDIVPTKKLYVFGYDEDQQDRPYSDTFPVDQYFGYLDGPFNSDGDSNWGEPTDGENGGDVDLFADVYVGRACVDNLQDVNRFVEKTIEYINMDAEDEYLDKVILAGEFLGTYNTLNFGGTLNDGLVDLVDRDGFVTQGFPSDKYNIEKIYDRDWPGFDSNDPWSTGWPTSALWFSINRNVHFLHHDGHSNYIYNMKMTIEYIDQFTNTKPFFAYSSGCMAGGFDYPDADCFAEYLTVKTENGAFAGLWNARYGFFWADRTDGDGSMHSRQFYDAIFGEGITEIGKANQDSKEDNLHLLDRSMMRWTNYGLNLFGDPSVNFHISKPPNKPAIEGPSSGKTGQTYTYTAMTTEPDGEQIYYKFDWGDGTESKWLGPYSSGDTIEESHNWNSRGSFEIKVIAKDMYGEQSPWSDSLSLSISRTRSNRGLLIERLLKIIFDLFQ